ncbi:MAG: hypothetical protein IJW43_02670 [Clostridia bacterium]|nr:hypothetical protein [Clostridia bacterium]
MEKLYGFKESDVIGLIEYVKENKGKKLTEIFSGYASKTNKANGTIRNLYYTIAKRSNSDEEFSKKLLSGEKIQVEKKVEFSVEEEKRFAREILIKKAKGKSIRRAVLELSCGDQKLALRYQNKFRSMLKNKPETLQEIAIQIERDFPSLKPRVRGREERNALQVERLKREINRLFERTFIELKKENALLKSMLKESSGLGERQEKNESSKRIEEFFKAREGKNFL